MLLKYLKTIYSQQTILRLDQWIYIFHKQINMCNTVYLIDFIIWLININLELELGFKIDAVPLPSIHFV